MTNNAFKQAIDFQFKQGNSIIKLLFIMFILFLFSNSTHAQTRGKLEIVKDPRIDSLITHRQNMGRGGTASTGSNISAYGYRVQFYSGSNRKEAFNAQNKLQQIHPELRTYINYKEPNFKVKAGDFRTRLEAAKLVQELKGVFTTLFVISEKINPPKLDTNTNPQ